ncbi:J domain-containing protein [Halobacteriales archaeon Cl-PHB]
METYYECLGVDPDATTAEIRAAYRNRLTEVHPDVSDDPDAGEATKRLIAAKEVLTDETERRRYDRLGHQRYLERAGQSPSTGDPTSADDTIDWDVEPTGHTAAGDWDDPRDSTGTRPGEDDTVGHEKTHRRSTGRGPTAGTRDERHRGAQSPAGDRDTHEGNTTWRTQAEGAWAVSNRRRAGVTRLDLSGSSLLVLFAAFLLYPLMLWAALFPRFPLVVNVLVGLCVVGEVFYLQSMPSVGTAVFGTWTVLLPAILIGGFGLPLGSPVVLVAGFGTGVPLILSLLTWLVLRL